MENIDHRKIGIDQELFFFHELSPGSAFWLPNGTRLYNKLMNFIRDEYYKRGFQEVITPVLGKQGLWEISGHWQKYKDDMFCLEHNHDESDDDTSEKTDDKQQYAMKPMQCPLACLMFKFKPRSYRELPLRLADFGDLHRNEASGALCGLLRGKKFRQDDAHIFCSQDQIKSEINGAIDFLRCVYSKFGFEFEVHLSTRPEKFIGEINVWNKAEKELAEVLNDTKLKWTEDPQGGAFYGPKIDIKLTDSLGRKHQCATIQLDFQLPSKDRFDLTFVNNKNELETPVIIHRAIYGSFERFVAILCEHYKGKFPFWLNPRQIKIISVADKFFEYAKYVQNQLRKHKFFVDVDETDNTLQKKVKDAQLEQYNYILVVGQKEMETQTINVRYRDNENKKMCTIDELIGELLLQQ